MKNYIKGAELKHQVECVRKYNSAVIPDDISPLEDVGDVVWKLTKVFSMFEKDQIKPYGFTTSQCYALLEIYNVKSITMSELSSRMNLCVCTMTRVLDNLERDKYVRRDREQHDRRTVIISLTENGKDAAESLNRVLNMYYKRVIEFIPESQVDDILKSAGILLDAFEKANPNCCFF